MALPDQPVTLTVAQLADLHQRLSKMRHDINNMLSLITAAAELSRMKPEVSERMMGALAEQPPKISQALAAFAAEFDQAFGITKPATPRPG